MRLREIGAPQHRLLKELSGQISNRLEVEFRELPDGDGPSIGVELQERGHRVVMELPVALLLRAEADQSAREAIRVRIKSRRDRMLFRPPPEPLPKRIAALADPGGFRFGPGRGPSRGRR